jgi:hypothetical protein
MAVAACSAPSSVNVNVANGPLGLVWPADRQRRLAYGRNQCASNLGGALVNFYVDGNYLTSSPPYTTYWKSSSVSNGVHTLSARAYSSSGQVGADSVVVNVEN